MPFDLHSGSFSNDVMTRTWLELHDSTGGLLATNNDWRVTQLGGVITGDQESAIEATTIAPTDDLESAIIATLAPGNYTAVVRGTNDGTGIGLAVVQQIVQLHGGRIRLRSAPGQGTQITLELPVRSVETVHAA